MKENEYTLTGKGHKKQKPILMLNEFQKRCKATGAYPDYAKIIYPSLGLCGEVGEFLEVLLKAIWPTEEDCTGILECNIYACYKKMIEAGKACEQLKKIIRDKDRFEKDICNKAAKKFKDGLEKADKEQLIAELGDFMSWYCNVLAYDLGFKATDVLKKNLQKVERRKKQGKIHGSGSNR